MTTTKGTDAMMTTTTQEPPRHPFDRAGLGKPPYTFLGVEHKTFQSCPDAPVQPGGSCDYCGTGIYDHFYVRSADGNRFKVGCDCIEKVSKSAKDFPSQRALDVAVRAHKADLRHAREAEKIAEGKLFIEAHKAELAAIPHPVEYFRAQGQTLLDSIEWYLSHAGNKGRLDAIKTAHAALEVVS